MVIPAGFAQVNFKHTGVGVPTGAEWTLGLALPSTATDPAVVADEVASIYQASGLRQLMASTVTMSTVLVKFGPDASGPSAEESTLATGANPDPGMQPGTCLLVKKLTLAGGRAGRGRLYFPGLVEVNVEPNGAIRTPFVTQAQLAFTKLRTDLNTALLTPVLLHGADSPLSVPTPITALVVQSTAATQRRRLRR